MEGATGHALKGRFVPSLHSAHHASCCRFNPKLSGGMPCWPFETSHSTLPAFKLLYLPLFYSSPMLSNGMPCWRFRPSCSMFMAFDVFHCLLSASVQLHQAGCLETFLTPIPAQSPRPSESYTLETHSSASKSSESYELQDRTPVIDENKTAEDSVERVRTVSDGDQSQKVGVCEDPMANLNGAVEYKTMEWYHAAARTCCTSPPYPKHYIRPSMSPTVRLSPNCVGRDALQSYRIILSDTFYIQSPMSPPVRLNSIWIVRDVLQSSRIILSDTLYIQPPIYPPVSFIPSCFRRDTSISFSPFLSGLLTFNDLSLLFFTRIAIASGGMSY